MKTARIFATFASLLLLASMAIPAVCQAPPAQGRRPRIAIMDFDYATVHSYSSAMFGADVDIGKGISDMLVNDLVKDGTFSVIERKALEKIMAEQNLSNSNRADPTSAAKLGKLLGVDAILVGSITQFGNETKKIGLGGAGGTFGGFGMGGIGHSKSNANVVVSARLVNVDTGEILAVAEGKGASSRSSTSLLGGGSHNWISGNGNVDFGSSDFQSTIIGEATKQAVDQLSVGIVGGSSKVAVRTITVEGIVAAVDGGQIILNVGGSAGVKVGDQLQIVRVTKEIKDPTTGAVLRKLTTQVGVVRATDVDAASSVCTPVSGSGFQTGDLAKSVAQ